MKKTLKTVIPILVIGAVSFAAGTRFNSIKHKPNVEFGLQQVPVALNNAMMEEKEIKRLHKNYLDYRNSVMVKGNTTFGDSSLTRYITMKPEIFEFIGDYITKHKNEVSAIRFVMIRYDKKYADASIAQSGQIVIKGKMLDQQNSIAILPVDKDGKTNYNAWSPTEVLKINKFNKLKGLELKKVFSDGFNHGSICPANCDDDN